MKADIAIIGAGFAGAATAYHLSRSFQGSILLVEREDRPGTHASGRNASLVLQSTALPEISQAVARSHTFLATHASELGFRQTGSLLLGSPEMLDSIRCIGTVASESLDCATVTGLVPLLEGHGFERGLWTPSDGVVNVASLLEWYLRSAGDKGAQVLCNAEVREIREGPPFIVETTAGAIQADCIVNAAGAWAPRIAALAHASRLPLHPLKRHLFHLGGAQAGGDWPFVWNLEKNFYFRADQNDLLFCLCDEEDCSSLVETVSPGICDQLTHLLDRELPRLRQCETLQVWSCFRTKTPDGRFVIGWDPCLEGFFWVAGLGGHGVGSSWEVGRIAAELLLRRPDADAGGHRSERWSAALHG